MTTGEGLTREQRGTSSSPGGDQRGRVRPFGPALPPRPTFELQAAESALTQFRAQDRQRQTRIGELEGLLEFASGELEQAQRQRTSQANQQPSALSRFSFQGTRVQVGNEELENELNRAIDSYTSEIDSLLIQQQQSFNRQLVVQYVNNPEASPLWLADESTGEFRRATRDEIISIVQSGFGYRMDNSDIAWLDGFLGAVDEEFDARPDTTSLVDFFLRSDPGEPIHLSRLTVEETLRYYTEGTLAQPTQAELDFFDVGLRSFLAGAGDLSQTEAYQEAVELQLESIREVQADIQASREGLRSLALPELGTWEALYLASGQVALDIVEQYSKSWAQPIAGALLIESERLQQKVGFRVNAPLYKLLNFTSGIAPGLDVSGTPRALAPLNDLFDEYNTTDSRWRAYQLAFENWDTNQWTKLGLEVALDPLSYLGFGFTGKALAGIPKVGNSLAAANLAYARFWDGVFRGITYPFRTLGRTKSQKALARSTEVHRAYLKHAFQRFGVNVAEMNTHAGAQRWYNFIAKSVSLIGEEALQTEGTEWTVQAMLLEATPLREISRERIAGIARVLGSDIITSDEAVTLTQYNDVQDILNLALGRNGQPEQVSIAASKLIDVLAPGRVGNANSLRLATRALDDYVTDLKNSILEIATPGDAETGYDVIARMATETQSSLLELSRVPTQIFGTGSLGLGRWQYNYQKGVVSSIMSGIDSTTRLLWTDSIERYLVTPFARAYLVFGFYGLGNILEGLLKPAVEGLSPFNPLSRRTGFFANKTSSVTSYQMLATQVDEPVIDLINLPLDFAENIGSVARGSRRDLGNFAEQILAFRFLANIPGAGRNLDAYHWLVRYFGRVGLLQRADFMVKATHRALHNQNPQAYERIERVFQRHLANRPRTDTALEDYMIDQIRYGIFVNESVARQIPEIVRANIPELRLQELRNRYPDLDNYVFDTLRTSVIRGEAASPEQLENIKQLVIEVKEREPRAMIGRMQQFFEEFQAMPVENFTDFQNKLGVLVDIDRMRQEYVHNLNSNAVRRAQGLQARQRDTHYNRVLAHTDVFIDQSNDYIQQATDLMRAHLGDASPRTFDRRNIVVAQPYRRQREQILGYIDNLPVEFKLRFNRRIRITTDDESSIYRMFFDRYLTDLIDRRNMQPLVRYLTETGRSDAANYITSRAFRQSVQQQSAREYRENMLAVLRVRFPDLIRDVTEEFIQYARATSPENYAPWDTIPAAFINDSYNIMSTIWPKELSVLFPDEVIMEVIQNNPELVARAPRITAEALQRLQGQAPRAEGVRDAAIGLLNLMDERREIWSSAIRRKREFDNRHFRTPRRRRDDAFWRTRDARTNSIFDEAKRESDNLTRTREIEYRSVLASAERPPRVLPPTGQDIANTDVLQLMGLQGRDLQSSILEFQHQLVDRDTWIATVQGKAGVMGRQQNVAQNIVDEHWSADRVGRVYDRLKGQMLFSDRYTDSRFAPLLEAIDRMWDDYLQIRRLAGVDEDTGAQVARWLNGLIDELAFDSELQEIGWSPVRTGQPNTWRDDWNVAHGIAQEEYFGAFADYSHPTILNQFMRSIFPYWTYEAHRWHWVTREAIRHPGMAHIWGGYMDGTDRGYIPIPGTEQFQVNLLRGSIWMGGMTSLLRQDYASFNDLQPAISEPTEFLGRFGFYPNVLFTGLNAAIGPRDPNRDRAWLDIVPSTWTTAIYGAQATPGVSESLGRWLDTVFSSGYRDYYIITEMAHIISEEGTVFDPDEINAADIWVKLQNNETLTELEQELYNRAFRQSAQSGLIINQAGVARLRPRGLIEAQQESRRLIAEWTGVSEDEQDRLAKDGYRYNDFIRRYLTIDQQQILNRLDAFNIWTGRTLPLQPSWESRERAIWNEFYGQVENVRENVISNGVIHPVTEEEIVPGMASIDEVFRATGDPAAWRSSLSDIFDAMATFPSLLSQLPRYQSVPFTRQQREEYWQEHGRVPLQWSPEEELLFLWWETQPETIRRYNQILGHEEEYVDWDTYFAKVEIISSLLRDRDPELYARFTDRLDKNLTPLGKVYRTYQRTVQPAFRGLVQLVLSQYTPEQQEIIRSHRQAPNDRRMELEQIEIEEGGLRLISSYQSAVEEARRRWREAHPEAEAQMLFWGDVTSPQTTQAYDLYLQLRRDHRVVPPPESPAN